MGGTFVQHFSYTFVVFGIWYLVFVHQMYRASQLGWWILSLQSVITQLSSMPFWIAYFVLAIPLRLEQINLSQLPFELSSEFNLEDRSSVEAFAGWSCSRYDFNDETHDVKQARFVPCMWSAWSAWSAAQSESCFVRSFSICWMLKRREHSLRLSLPMGCFTFSRHLVFWIQQTQDSDPFALPGEVSLNWQCQLFFANLNQ